MNRISNWYTAIPKSDIDAAAEESFVDAYNDYEKHTGVLTMIDERLVFPFAAKVMGNEVAVVGMEWSVNEELGLDLVVQAAPGEERHRIAARNVEPLKPYPEGVEFLALYLQWRGQF